MNPEDSLKSQIAMGNPQGAKILAHSMSPDSAGSVLQELADHGKPSVRLLVLDIAAEVRSEGACRAILSRLLDANLTVRSVANSLTGCCTQKNVAPDLFAVLDQDIDLRVKGVVARQIGIVGGVGDLPRLRRFYKKTRERKLRDDIAAAMARLGDSQSRAVIVQPLTAPGVDARVAALHDIEYIGDAQLASHFRPVMDDRREAMVVSLPHSPRVIARVCDIAVGSLKALGLPLSFRALPLRRFSQAEVEEALRLIASIPPSR
jgi:hypothetical protein